MPLTLREMKQISTAINGLVTIKVDANGVCVRMADVARIIASFSDLPAEWIVTDADGKVSSELKVTARTAAEAAEISALRVK